MVLDIHMPAWRHQGIALFLHRIKSRLYNNEIVFIWVQWERMAGHTSSSAVALRGYLR